MAVLKTVLACPGPLQSPGEGSQQHFGSLRFVVHAFDLNQDQEELGEVIVLKLNRQNHLVTHNYCSSPEYTFSTTINIQEKWELAIVLVERLPLFHYTIFLRGSLMKR